MTWMIYGHISHKLSILRLSRELLHTSVFHIGLPIDTLVSPFIPHNIMVITIMWMFIWLWLMTHAWHISLLVYTCISVFPLGKWDKLLMIKCQKLNYCNNYCVCCLFLHSRCDIHSHSQFYRYHCKCVFLARTFLSCICLQRHHILTALHQIHLFIFDNSHHTK